MKVKGDSLFEGGHSVIERDKKLLGFARKLRREMTPLEAKLWYQFLRGYPLKVYKQRIIGSYIADFYCD